MHRLFLLVALLPLAAQAGTIMTQGQLDNEIGTPCAAQGAGAPCITPTRMSDLVVTSVPLAASGIAAAGTSQGTATPLSAQMNAVTAVAPGAGVILPPPVAGQSVWVANQGANRLTVYPPAGAAIDGLAANWPMRLEIGVTAQWIALSPTAISTVP
jgi:hypothetical protein